MDGQHDEAYAGQNVDGDNEYGCPYANQTGEDAVQHASDVLAALGYASFEDLQAAAGLDETAP